ncbi:MAG: NAD(P)H-hydrate dehydratase [Lentisphaerae bacterium]|nr:NAD(P)H-hydrate dehydratase [Lentisphaerota bacterium]
MKLVTTNQMRDLDRSTIEEFGVPGEELMDRAGAGVHDVVCYLARMCGYRDPSVLLIAGRGNNGGDAFVAARYLAERRIQCEVWLAGDADSIRGDALKHLAQMRSAGVKLRELPTLRDWDEAMAFGRGADIIVDGVLGTGLAGPARGPAAGAIRWINSFADRSLVVSIDAPSGLNAAEGTSQGGAVVADITATMGLPKIGLVLPTALEYVGVLEVIDIGIPSELEARIESDMELITASDLQGLFPRRRRDSHKGTYGHVLLVGGSPGYAGAIGLAATAAARSGVGLVTALVPRSVAPVVAGLAPEAMVHSGKQTRAGSLAADCLDEWGRDLAEFDAVLVGPGLSQRPSCRSLVEQLLGAIRNPMVLDADALNLCGGRAEVIRNVQGQVILTPHPGEMARLLGCSVADVQADRCGVAACAAELTGSVVVLKGAGTLVAAEGRPIHVNLTGNPGMATGGTGDVLGGIIAGLLAQGLDPFDAARASVYLHGRAGDNVAWRASQAGILAGDLVEEIPNVFRDVSPR